MLRGTSGAPGVIRTPGLRIRRAKKEISIKKYLNVMNVNNINDVKMLYDNKRQQQTSKDTAVNHQYSHQNSADSHQYGHQKSPIFAPDPRAKKCRGRSTP